MSGFIKTIWKTNKFNIFSKSFFKRKGFIINVRRNRKEEEWIETENIINKQKEVKDTIGIETKTRNKQINKWSLKKNYRVEFKTQNIK